MNAIDLNNLSSTYNLSPIEINCIILSLAIDNKLLAFNYTIAYQNKAKNKDVLCNRFFHREETQRFISEQRNNFIDNRVKVNNENLNRSDVQSVDVTQWEKQNFDNETRITSDNIQALLENQYAKTNDAEKKVLLLMKIAEFVGAKKTTEDSANLPVIYLPSRCKECSYLKK